MGLVLGYVLFVPSLESDMTPFGIRKKLKALLGGSKAPPKPAVPKYQVTFELPDGSSYEVPAKHGDTLVLASGRGASPISTGCADSTCGTCQVEVLAGVEMLSPEDESERRTKAETSVPATNRLGCRTEVLGEGVRVKIINVFGEEEYMP
ncbi:MAG: ferredoxin [Myxococcota bacterium]|jgi:ferredoxin